ncbi:Rib/alpha-like domain-containing protein, partial [Lactobacillus mulieris]
MNCSKNNRNLRNREMMEQKPHYALRKLSVGVASVLLSTTLYMMESGNAQATVTSNNQTNQSLVEKSQNEGENSQPTAQTEVIKQQADKQTASASSADIQNQLKSQTPVESNAASDTQASEKVYKANLVDSTNQPIKILTAKGNVGEQVNTNWTEADLPTGWKLADKQSLPTEVTINSDDTENTTNITIEHALRPATDKELNDLYLLSSSKSMYEVQKLYTRYITYQNEDYLPLKFQFDDESGWMNSIKGTRDVQQFMRYTWDTQIDEVTNQPVFSNFKPAEITTKIFDGSTLSEDDLKYMVDKYYLNGKWSDSMRAGVFSVLLSDNRLSKYIQVHTNLPGDFELQGESYQFKPGYGYRIVDSMSWGMMTKKVEHYTTPQLTNKGVSFNKINFSNFDVQKEMDKATKIGDNLRSPDDLAYEIHDMYDIIYGPCDSEKFIHKQKISDENLNNLIANAKKCYIVSDQDQEKWIVTPDTANVGSGFAGVTSGSISNHLSWSAIPYTVLSTKDVDGPNVKRAQTPLTYMVGDKVSDDDAIKALDKDTIPSDATVTWTTEPTTNTIGDRKATAHIVFGDGTYEDIIVPYNVVSSKNVEGKDITKADTNLSYKKGDPVSDTDAAKALKGVPSDATVAWVEGHKPDTSSYGKNKQAQVEVTFGNGDKQQYDVVYDVVSSKDVEGKNIDKADTNLPYKKGDPVSDTDAAKTLKGVPSDAKVAWVSRPDTSEVGKNKTAKVEVTFGNGDK